MEEGRVEGGGGGLVVADEDTAQSLGWRVARVQLALVLVGEGGEAEEGEAGDQVQTPDCAQAAWIIYNGALNGQTQISTQRYVLFRAKTHGLSLVPGGEGERYSNYSVILYIYSTAMYICSLCCRAM